MSRDGSSSFFPNMMLPGEEYGSIKKPHTSLIHVTENDIEATAASSCVLVPSKEAVKTRSGKCTTVTFLYTAYDFLLRFYLSHWP